MFKLMNHVSDLKYKIEAKSLEALFEDAGFAVQEAIFKDSKLSNNKETIELKGKDINMLLHDFIEELLYIAYSEYKYFHLLSLSLFFDEETETYFLKANLAVRKAKKTDYNVEIKACSYNIKIIKDKNNNYVVEFILDI